MWNYSILFKFITFFVIVVVGFVEGFWVLGYIGLGEIGKVVVEG